MMAPFRFLVDESSWSDLAEFSLDEVEDLFHNLADCIQRAKERDERVAKFSDIWEFSVGDESVYDWLYLKEEVDWNARRRVYSILDKLPCWDEQLDCPFLEYERRGVTTLGPSVSLAHHFITKRLAVGLFPLCFREFGGPDDVTVAEVTHQLHFVTNEREHREFFRAAIELERVTAKRFEALARSAFPDLSWADSVFKDINNFSKPFIAVRDTVVGHLSVLNDDASRIFAEKLATAPSEIETLLASAGVTASDENSKVKSNNEARRARTRQVDGEDYIFYWHTKLEPHIDRIHFLYDQDSHKVIVGLFTTHCEP